MTANLGGYIYGGQPDTFFANALTGLELSNEPLHGTWNTPLQMVLLGSILLLPTGWTVYEIRP